MTANRKILVFGRHGRAPQKPDGGGSIDSLFPETVPVLYEVGAQLREFVSAYGIEPVRTFLHHSSANRTKYTGEAILVGAFDLQPRSGENPPQCVEDLLQHYDFRNATYRDSRLLFGSPFANMEIYNRNNQVCNGNVDYWLANPTATEHDGAAIEPYSSVEPRIREATRDALQRFMSDEYDFGILITHAGLTETVAAILIGTAQRVEKCDDIGGGFAMAQSARLVIDKSAGGVCTATVERNGQSYPVDLEKLR